MTATPTEQKWTLDGLGPRQAKSVSDALSKFGWAAKTIREVTDHGSFDMTPMVLGTWSELAVQLMAEIKEKYSCTITKENYMQVEAELLAATAKLKANPPIVDRRSTQEERDERDAARIERERIEAEKAAHLATLQTHEYSLAETSKLIKHCLTTFYPATKFSVRCETYAGGCSIDASWIDGPTDIGNILTHFEHQGFDGMTDSTVYYDRPEWNGHRFKFSGSHIRGQRSHSAAHLLAACERYVIETSKPSPEVIEDGSYCYLKRDNEPCGYSFFTSQPDEYPEGLICTDSMGHHTACDIVNAIAGHTGEAPTMPIDRDTIFAIVLGVYKLQPGDVIDPADGSLVARGVTVSRNEEKDGIEIRFAAKPERATLDSLKARGWRWSRFSSCWWHKHSPEALAFAERLAGGE